MTNNNSIFVIFPYKLQEQWLFDDQSVGLYHEPFISGADIFLDRISKGKTEITTVFSSTYFPTARWVIEKINKECESGAWYYSKDFDMQLWLCDACLLYISPHPDKIFIEVK